MTSTIKQSVINTFNRVGIDYKKLDNTQKSVMAFNRFTMIGVPTTPLLAHLVSWIYSTSNDYEYGIQNVNLSDFDRIKYFIADQDSEVYMNCID